MIPYDDAEAAATVDEWEDLLHGAATLQADHPDCPRCQRVAQFLRMAMAREYVAVIRDDMAGRQVLAAGAVFAAVAVMLGLREWADRRARVRHRREHPTYRGGPPRA